MNKHIAVIFSPNIDRSYLNLYNLLIAIVYYLDNFIEKKLLFYLNYWWRHCFEFPSFSTSNSMSEVPFPHSCETFFWQNTKWFKFFMRSEYVKEKLFPFKVESCASFIIDDQIGFELYFPSILVNFLIEKKS